MPIIGISSNVILVIIGVGSQESRCKSICIFTWVRPGTNKKANRRNGLQDFTHTFRRIRKTRGGTKRGI